MVAVTALIEQELSHANEVLARGIKPSALYNEIVKDAPALALDPPKSTSVPADLPTRPTDPAMIEKIRRCFKNAEEMKLLEGARVYADNVIFKEQINPRLIELGTCVQRALGGRSLRFKAAEIAGAR